MRLHITFTALVAVAMIGLSGCQTSSWGGIKPFWSKKSGSSSASGTPAPQLPTAGATPGSSLAPPYGATNGNGYANNYPAQPASYPQGQYPATQTPTYDPNYGVNPAATPTGAVAPVSNSTSGTPQNGPYNAGGYSQPAATPSATPYGGAERGDYYRGADNSNPGAADSRAPRYEAPAGRSEGGRSGYEPTGASNYGYNTGSPYESNGAGGDSRNDGRRGGEEASRGDGGYARSAADAPDRRYDAAPEARGASRDVASDNRESMDASRGAYAAPRGEVPTSAPNDRLAQSNAPATDSGRTAAPRKDPFYRPGSTSDYMPANANRGPADSYAAPAAQDRGPAYTADSRSTRGGEYAPPANNGAPSGGGNSAPTNDGYSSGQGGGYSQPSGGSYPMNR